MHFAKNPETKFRMALECGALEKAFDIARSLSDSTQAFNQLAELSLVFGDIKVRGMLFFASVIHHEWMRISLPSVLRFFSQPPPPSLQ